jgi:hypothetical protein
MNPNPHPPKTQSEAALLADVDQLLAAHLAAPAEQLTPSSGFTLSVMDAIHQQATEPPPIAFPWRRVIPGIIAILCTLAAFLIFAATHPTAPTHLLPAPSAFTPLELVLTSIFLAACLSAVAIAASFRLAGRTR